ncbi:MAG: hypothetical protein K9M54_09735 [Kiritimatiellales bacterium]|nr:hypothetical protein [Kiritimatiellales bacterium]
MNGLWLIFAAAILLIASGIPACFCARTSIRLQRLTTALVGAGSMLGWWGLVVASFGAAPCSISLSWHLPGGHFAMGLDALSAVFLIPVFTVPLLGSIYGLSYWRQSEHPGNGRGLGLFYGLLAGAMALVVVSRDSILFLIAWELMALAAFLLVGTESEKGEVRRAGWIYLVATHAGTLCLFALFALLRQVSGGFGLAALDAELLTSGTAATLFILTIIGFGFKAGLMPLHFWLPGAHANAPSHVSAVMSGVLLKMGIYGILRMLSLLPVALWNGEVLLAVGAATGILGIAFAIGQSDIKRLLAYSSIENIGIITMGIGLALVGRVLHRDDFILLGLGGALLHVWNHSLFKPLLFMNAGTIMHAAHTRDMNRMGGLAKSMPVTAGLFVLGAVAICGLPPLNGFASEWLIYLGLFHGVGSGVGVVCPVAGAGAAALAMIGALALACFVKMYSTVFLGVPRHPVHGQPHDPTPAMRYPMVLLAAGCIVLGFLPSLGFPLLRQAASQWLDPTGVPAVPLFESFAPFQWISGMAVALVVVAGLGIVLLRRRIRRRNTDSIGTWGCGYALPTPRMQYTASSFGDTLVALFAWVLHPRIQRPVISSPFPAQTEFSTEVSDVVLEQKILPVVRMVAGLFERFRALQRGPISQYLLYVAITVVVLLVWTLPLGSIFKRLFQY